MNLRFSPVTKAHDACAHLPEREEDQLALLEAYTRSVNQADHMDQIVQPQDCSCLAHMS
jgi:hypothetical protein